jgi:hypothetical protein
VEVSGLPRSAADLKSWSSAVCDNVMACSAEGDAAYAWILCVEDDDCTFEAMANCERRFIHLDAKLRTALTKYTTGEAANKYRELADEINKAAGVAKKAKVPLRGRQLFFMIRQFFQVDMDKRILFDLTDLTKIEYTGDANMHKFLNNWDNMLDNMKIDRTLIPAEFLGSQLIEAIRGSEKLRTHVEHYDRQTQDHPDHSYAFIHRMLGKVVVEERQRKNKEHLLIDHAAARRRPTAAPASRGGSDDGGDGDSVKSDASVRVKLGDIEYKDRCCIRNLWQKCTETVENGGCKFGPHVKVAPEIIQRHSLYLKMVEENGAPKKGKEKKGKGKGKGKDATPAAAGVELEAAAEPTP